MFIVKFWFFRHNTPGAFRFLRAAVERAATKARVVPRDQQILQEAAREIFKNLLALTAPEFPAYFCPLWPIIATESRTVDPLLHDKQKTPSEIRSEGGRSG
jgi:hypothetical protein